MNTAFVCFIAAVAALCSVAVLGNKPKAIVYSSAPQLLHKLEGGDTAQGITSLGDEVFIKWLGIDGIEVYEVNTWTRKRNIPVPELVYPNDMVLIERYNSLYISDFRCGCVFKVDLTDERVTKWPVGDGPFTLFVTVENNIIITFTSANLVKEFTHDGQLIREINLENVPQPGHTVQLLSGDLLVSHSYPVSELCLINDAGNATQCYTGLEESGPGKLSWPQYIVVDRQGQILVGDTWNDRILLLTRSLNYNRVLISKSNDLMAPARMYLDGVRGLLYVAEWGGHGTNVRTVDIYKVIDE